MKNKWLFIAIFILIVVIFYWYFKFYHTNKGDEAAAINLYKDLFDKILEDKSASDYDYIAIATNTLSDPLNFNPISKRRREELFEYLKKYNDNISKLNMDKLIYDDTTGKKSKGLTIAYTITQNTKNEFNILVNCYGINIGSWSRGYVCTYKKHKWDIIDTGTAWDS